MILCNIYMEEEEKHPNEWTFMDFLIYVKNHYHKFLLLLLAIVIIVVIDHITNINATLFSFPSPVLGVPTTTNVSLKNKKKNLKK